MTFTGQALLTMWNDFHPDHEIDYNQWHALEHMPERLSVPGFIAGRRYRLSVDEPENQRYFAMYQTENLEVFQSERYLELLNNPSDWSQRIQPHFVNFVRSGAQPILSIGQGISKYIATIRIITDDPASLAQQLPASLTPLTEKPGVTALHIAQSRSDSTSVATAETNLRKDDVAYPFDILVLIEGWDRDLLGSASNHAVDITRQLGQDSRIVSGIYELVYSQVRDS